MARLRLTIHNVTDYSTDSAANKFLKDLCISTERDTDTALFPINSKNEKKSYTLSLVDFSFKKQMYQPTEIIADIQLSSGDAGDMKRATLDTIFKFKKVTLEEITSKESDKPDTLVQTIGNDYYVHEVEPRYKSDALYVTLKIYSLDKLLTINQVSRTFVGKRLGTDILSTEMPNYKIPYDTDHNVAYNTDNMKHLFYATGKEHFFPYLVQYNESFYDMLARTANCWGEFMYYEDNKLNFGYDDKPLKTISDGYANISYLDLGTTPTVASAGTYDCAGAPEKGFGDATLRESPNTISGTLFWPTTKKWDKVLMKEITAFLKNDKNIPTWLGNRLFDNTWDLAVKLADMKKGNDIFDKTYFPSSNKPGNDEQYGEYDFGDDKDPDKDSGYNLFSEINSVYKESLYNKILEKELKVAKNVICIDYDTTCPKLKLGDIISVSDEKFIVVSIDSRIKVDYKYKKKDDSNEVVKVPISSLVFQVIGTPIDDDKTYYPAVIPAGHVRMADPQIATITDADDPDGKNRVRVMFPWQKITYVDEKEKDEISADTKKNSSPWLTFTTGGAGSPVIGKHYEGNKVLIGFVNGNVERPYVLGGLTSEGADSDYVQTTPGGHQFTLSDDQDGIKSFLTGMFLPCVGTFSPFLTAIPGVQGIADAICKPAKKDKNNPAMGGGFELSDNYGIYKISGSTDGREIAIASPWGDVNISAFTGITISAPNGDVTITGKNIKLEAGNNVDIISGTNVKNKILGGNKSGFGTDVAVAVAKKLADKLTNIIDLSIIRSALEIIFRPAEGALHIKSNRFLMLEAGKGQCVYPRLAYSSDDAFNEAMSDLKKSDFRPGMKLSSGFVEMFSKVITLGNMFDSRFMNAYNKCVDLQEAYSKLLKDRKICKWHNKFSTATLEPEVAKKYEQIIDKFWADGNGAITEPDLSFSDDYKPEAGSIDDTVKNLYANENFGGTRNDEVDALGVTYIIGERTKNRRAILDAANELRKAIIAFKSLPQLTEKEIQKTFRFVRDRNMPKDCRTALVEAFKKDKLVDGDDVFYFKAPTEAQKKLNTRYTSDSLKPHRIILERKAAMLTLEKMGFKDEWRERIDNPDYGVDGKATKDLKTILKVDRKFKADEISDDAYWESYVDSLVTLPKLNSLEWKAVTEFKKKAMENFNGLKFWECVTENNSWGDANDGGILFSFDSNIYNLKKNIEDVPAPWKEQLTVEDDLNNDVKGFLNGIKNKMKSIK